MNGYDPDFLGTKTLPLPSFSPELLDEVHMDNHRLKDGMIAEYVHYSLAMNEHPDKRSPLFVALNIHQDQFKKTDRGDRWRTDGRIDKTHQLDNDYYRRNVWDRGHMAKRQTTAWGSTLHEAQRADDDSFYYTNSVLQHENLNQDEWAALEDWVYQLKLAKDGKICSFSGPIYGDTSRSIRPPGRRVALIPAGFFKIVCFINKDTHRLDVRTFVMYQDEAALFDKRGRKAFNNQTYQVTVAEVELLTGLRFDESIHAANPLLASDSSIATGNTLNIGETPERLEVGSPSQMIAGDTPRPTLKDDIVDIYISAAMVDPIGQDKKKEWISLINLGHDVVDLTGWSIRDNADKDYEFSAQLSADQKQLHPGCSIVLTELKEIRLSNQGDVIRLYNGNNERIDWVNYTQRMVETGKPVVFLSPRDTLL